MDFKSTFSFWVLVLCVTSFSAQAEYGNTGYGNGYGNGNGMNGMNNGMGSYPFMGGNYPMGGGGMGGGMGGGGGSTYKSKMDPNKDLSTEYSKSAMETKDKFVEQMNKSEEDATKQMSENQVPKTEILDSITSAGDSIKKNGISADGTDKIAAKIQEDMAQLGKTLTSTTEINAKSWEAVIKKNNPLPQPQMTTMPMMVDAAKQNGQIQKSNDTGLGAVMGSSRGPASLNSVTNFDPGSLHNPPPVFGNMKP